MNDFKYILVDGSAFLFRSYYANLRQGLTSPDGLPTGAIFGCLSSIKKIERSYPDAKIILAFDAKGKNFRHKIYPEYKANRKDADEDLIIQIEPLYEILNNMHYHMFCIDQVEADDTIATIAKILKKKKIKTLIASSDKDLMQLIDDNTYQLDMKGNLLGREEVFQKTGVYPEQIMDLLALSGDSADNIPGIPSVGPKTAAKLLNKYINLINLKKNIADIGGKVGEKIRDNIANLDLSHKLVELKYDVVIPADIFSKPKPQNTQELIRLFRKYGLNAWLKELEGNNQAKQDIEKHSIIDKYSKNIIYQQNEFIALISALEKAKYFVLDLETTGLNYLQDSIVGIVLLIDKKSYYIPIAHNYLGMPEQLDGVEVLAKLKPILENEKIGKIGQNLKYDSHILKNHNINLNGIINDTMLMSFVLNSTATKHNMDDLSMYYLEYKTTKFKDIAGSGKKQLRFDEIQIEVAAKYALEDVIVTNELFLILANKLMQIPTLYKLYQQIELPLIKVMVDLERNGVLLDTKKLYLQNTEIENRINKIKLEIFTITGIEFNLDSPKQLKDVLFDEEGLNLQSSIKTKTGELSTNEETLKNLTHPIAKLLLEYRGLSKLNSTYLLALPKNINNKTGRLHTSYHQSGTATGRLSSSNPNLQNIPVRTEDGAKIRKAFIANKGNKIIALDYSQIELRLMAHISNDKGLIEAFNNNQDVHSSTAAMMFGKDINEIAKEDRYKAKAINFGLMYGMGAFKLAKQINVSRTEAKEYINSYFDNYPKVKNYMQEIEDNAKKHGFVETIRGRRLYVPNIYSKNSVAKEHAKRTAINFPMQGSSADIIKLAMLEIHKANLKAKMLLQVHDELVFEAPQNEAQDIAEQLQKIMQGVVKLQVPLVVDYDIADNWGDAH